MDSGKKCSFSTRLLQKYLLLDFAPSKTSGIDEVRESSGAVGHGCLPGNIFSPFSFFTDCTDDPDLPMGDLLIQH